MAKFAPYDMVRLNSGGPDMMVTRTIGTTVECAWYDPQGHILLDYFEEVTLTLISSANDIIEKYQSQLRERCYFKIRPIVS